MKTGRFWGDFYYSFQKCQVLSFSMYIYLCNISEKDVVYSFLLIPLLAGSFPYSKGPVLLWLNGAVGHL